MKALISRSFKGWIVVSAGVALLCGGQSALAQKAATAIASGACANAVNASGNSVVTIKKVCNYYTVSPDTRKKIDELIRQVEANRQKVQRDVAALQTADANLLMSVRDLSQQNDVLRDQLAVVVLRVEQLAAIPGASPEIKIASAQLARGEAGAAIKVLQERAEAAAATTGGDRREAAELFAQQAALLQTQDFAAARRAAERALGLDPDNLSFLAGAANLAYVTGDFRRAIELGGRMVGLARTKLAAVPQDTLAQRDLATALGALGFTEFASSDFAAAEKHYAESLALITALAERDPTNQETQRLLGAAFASASDAQFIAGHAVAALASAEQGVAIATRLVEAFPGDQMRYEVVGRRIKVGDLKVAMGQPDAAVDAYEAALALLEPIIAANPQVEAVYGDLAAIHSKIAYAKHARGDVDGAIANYRRSIEVAQGALKRSPQSPFWKRSVAIAYGSMGDAQASRPILNPAQLAGFTGEALESFEVSNRLFCEVAALDPENRTGQSDRWYALYRVGRVRALRGENLVALENLEKALVVMQGLAQGDPRIFMFQRQVGMTYGLIGNVQFAQSKRDDALRSFRKAMEQAEKVMQIEPKVAEHRRDLALYQASIGQLGIIDGDLAGGLALLRKALQVRKEIADSDPRNGQWQIDWALAHLAIATIPAIPAADRRQAFEAGLTILEAHRASGRTPEIPPGMMENFRAQSDAVGSGPS